MEHAEKNMIRDAIAKTLRMRISFFNIFVFAIT